MISISYIFLLSCVILFLLCWRIDSRNSLIITPFLLFAVCEIVFVWPSTIYAQSIELSPDAYPVFVVGLGFLSFLFAFVLFRRVFKYKTKMPDLFLKKSLIQKYPERCYFIAIFLAFIFLCAIGLYLYEGIPPLIKAIIGLIKGESGKEMASLVSSSRKYITKAHYFGGKYRGQGLIREFMYIGWPYLLSLSLLLYYKTKKFLWISISSILFLFLFIFVAGDGTRAPFLWCLVYLIFVISLVIKLKFRSMILVIICLFFLLMAISFLSPKLQGVLGKKDVIVLAGKKLTHRIFLGNGIDNVCVIEFIRSGSLDYRGGDVHFQKIMSSLPGVRYGIPFSRELNQLLHPHRQSTSYSSMTYLGTIYIDFGLIGVVFIYFLLGAVIAFAQSVIFTRKKRLLELPLITFAIFYLGRMFFNGIIGFISSFIVVLVCYFAIKFCLEIQYFALSRDEK